jgi:hypothetical protein
MNSAADSPPASNVSTGRRDGYVYVPDSDPGIFAGAKPGTVIRKPDRSPPWIVVDHAIESAVIARWPGRLWRAVVLDSGGVEQAASYANYTRAVAVKVIEEVPPSRLFGEHGDRVVAVLSFSARLDAATAARLAQLRYPDADRAYSRAFRTWLGVSCAADENESDFRGTLAAGQGPSRSPVNCGFTLLYRVVCERAEEVAGPAAFVVDDEGEWALVPVWGTAAAALLDAAMALGAPSVVAADADVLTAAWRGVGGST